MVLVFIFCSILLLVLLFIFFVLFSTVRLKIENFAISNLNREKIENKEESKTYNVIFSLYLFNKLKWLSFNLNSNRMKKIYNKMQLEKIDVKKLEQDFKLEDLKELKRLEPKVSMFKLDFKLGTESPILTSFLVFFISTVISILLPYVIKRCDKDNYKYNITPLYFQKNLYEIELNCIIEVKMVHIINIIYVLFKKRRVNKNERTSNRRSYDYSYE